MWTQVEQIMEEPTSRIVQRIAAFIPGLVAALIFILAAIVLAVVARTLTVRALRGMQFDRRAPQWGLGMLSQLDPICSISTNPGRGSNSLCYPRGIQPRSRFSGTRERTR